MNEIIGDYPTAFPKRETITIADLQNVRRRHASTSTTIEAETAAEEATATTLETPLAE